MAVASLTFEEMSAQFALKAFKVNEGVKDNDRFAARLPELDAFRMGLGTVDDYASYFTNLAKGHGGVDAMMKTIYQAHQIPPSVQTFAKISYLPNAQTQQFGVLQWPGLPPEVLEKLAREHLGPQMIISNRVDEVLKYSQMSTKPWEAGWQIVCKDPDEVLDAATKRDIREAEAFLLQGGIGHDFENPLDRDYLLRVDFMKFLASSVRNTLTFDGLAIWTERDKRGQIMSFAPMPAQQIRLLERPDRPHNILVQDELNFYGAMSPDDTIQREADRFQPYDFAVAVDETGSIVRKFTRKELIWYVRNPRLDVQVANYGYPEMEMSLNLVIGFTNAVKFNADIFDKNAIPKAILALKGQFCYAEDTEVLTKRGWITFDQADIETDEFATLNKSNSQFEWQKASEKVWEPYNGKMYNITSRSLDLLVTPNHNIVLQGKSILYNGGRDVKVNYNGKQSTLYNTIEAENLYNSLNKRDSAWMKKSKKFTEQTKYSEYWQIPVTAEWNGTEIESKTFSSQEKFGGQSVTISGDDFCAFMGMYLAEGNVARGNNKIWGAIISQRKDSKGWVSYNNLLNKIWGKEPYYNGRQFYIYNSELGKYLIQCGSDSLTKSIPDEIMNTSPRQMKIFLEYLILGDGYTRVQKQAKTNRVGRLKGVRYQITTSSKILSDQLQELSIKLGYSAGYSVCPAKEQCKFPIHTKPIAVGQDFVYEEDYQDYSYYDTHEYYQINLIGANAHPFSMEPTQYHGHIGCVTVPNHTLLVRRNGTTAFCGNTQRQLDAVGRVWDNLQRGPNTDWSLPVMQVSEKGAIELISLEPLRKESAYYQYLVNLFMGAMATTFRYPPHRLGYKISGTERDPRPDINKNLMEEDDIGLPVLLGHFENLINVYLFGRWPYLKFKFNGKTPKEDARLYEAWLNSMTWGEKRQVTGLPKASKMTREPAIKEIAEIMDLCPTDPGLIGAFQAILAAKSKIMGGSLLEDNSDEMMAMNNDPESNKGNKEQAGGKIRAKKDPAESEKHGHASGVRRDSRAEKESAGERQKPPSLRQPGLSNNKIDTSYTVGRKH